MFKIDITDLLDTLDDLLTGDVRGVPGAKEGDGSGDLGHLAHPEHHVEGSGHGGFPLSPRT